MFKTVIKRRRQNPVSHQLLILLSFLRTEGAGKSNRRGRSTYDVGSGTVGNSRDRCVNAIVDLLGDQIAWPDQEERVEIANRIERKFKFPNCIGIADGTLLPLAFRPETEDFADYFCRKRHYAITSITVWDFHNCLGMW